jgi:hypothetical protein
VIRQRIANAALLAGLILVASCRPASAQGLLERAHTASEWGVFGAHIYDGMTTQAALADGLREANWFLLRSTEPLEMAAMKTAGAVGTVYLTRKVKKAGHPVLAILTNVGVTSALLTIAYRNDGIRKAGQ